MALERVTHFVLEKLGPANKYSPKEFGIREARFAPTIVFDVTPYINTLTPQNQPTWITARRPGDNVHWLIGPDGKISNTGVVWDLEIPKLMTSDGASVSFIEDQSVYGGKFSIAKFFSGRVAVVRESVGDIVRFSRLLCMKTVDDSWEYIGSFVRGNALVSGVNNVGGPIRDIITKGTSADAPLMRSLKR